MWYGGVFVVSVGGICGGGGCVSLYKLLDVVVCGRMCMLVRCGGLVV